MWEWLIYASSAGLVVWRQALAVAGPRHGVKGA